MVTSAAAIRGPLTGRRPGPLLVLAATLLLTAMTCQGAQGFFAYNTSGRVLTVETVGSGYEESVMTVASGASNTLPVPNGGCRGTGVVARTEDGTVFATLDQPACDNDVWVLEEDRAYLQE